MVNSAILVPNKTTLAGSGDSTVITLPNAQNGSYNIIQNSDTASGERVTISDLQIDGNSTNQTAGNMTGIYFLGSGDSGAGVDGGAIQSVTVKNMYGGNGIYLNNSSHVMIRGNSLRGSSSNNGIFLNSGSSYNKIANNTTENNYYGVQLNASANNTISGNIAAGNTMGIFLNGTSDSNTVSGNITKDNSNYGIYLSGASSNTLSDNIVQANGVYGIFLNSSADSNEVSGNTLVTNSTYGIYLNGVSNNLITANRIQDNGGSTANNAIYVANSSSNTIHNNAITDPTHTSTNYAINIFDTGSSNNDLANNTLGGGSINDAGTGTIYSGQQNANGYFTFKASSTRLGIGTTSPSYMLDVSGDINTTTGYRINGTAGATVTCTGGQVLQNQTVAGGIVTGGSCAAVSGGTLQQAYTSSTGGTTPEIKLDSTRGGLDIQDANTSIAGSLLTVRASNAGGLGSALFDINSTGQTTFKNSGNSATAFQIQNATGGSLFVANTSNMRIYIGDATPDSVGVLLVLDNKNTSGDPTGTNGAMYYNSSTNTFRCFENSTWRDCINKPTVEFLVQAHSSSFAWDVPSALTPFGSPNDSRFRTQADLSSYNFARINLNHGGPAATGTQIALQYSTDGGSNWNYLDNSSGPVVTIGTSSTVYTSTWVALASGAKGDVQIRAVGFDGDGTTTTFFNHITLQVK